MTSQETTRDSSRAVPALTASLSWTEFNPKEHADAINTENALVLLCSTTKHERLFHRLLRNMQRAAHCWITDGGAGTEKVCRAEEEDQPSIPTRAAGSLAQGSVLSRGFGSQLRSASLHCFTFTSDENVALAERCFALYNRSPCLVYSVREAVYSEDLAAGVLLDNSATARRQSHADDDDDDLPEANFVLDFHWGLPTPLSACFFAYCAGCLCAEKPRDLLVINSGPRAMREFFARLEAGVEPVALQGHKPPRYHHFPPSLLSHGAILLEGKCAVTGTLAQFLPLPPPQEGIARGLAASRRGPRDTAALEQAVAAAHGGDGFGPAEPPPRRRWAEVGSLGVLWSHRCQCCPMMLMVMDQLVALLRGIARGLLPGQSPTSVGEADVPPPATAAMDRGPRTSPTTVSLEEMESEMEALDVDAGPSTFLVPATEGTGTLPVPREFVVLDEEAELMRFFLCNIDDNEIPTAALWPEPSDGGERTIPAIIAFPPLLTEDEAMEQANALTAAALQQCVAPEGEEGEEENDVFVDTLAQFRRLRPVLFQEEKSSASLLHFMATYCLPARPPPSLAPFFARACRVAVSNAPEEGAAEANALAAYHDWRTVLAEYAVEALAEENIYFDALKALMDDETAAFRRAIAISRQLEAGTSASPPPTPLPPPAISGFEGNSAAPVDEMPRELGSSIMCSSPAVKGRLMQRDPDCVALLDAMREVRRELPNMRAIGMNYGIAKRAQVEAAARHQRSNRKRERERVPDQQQQQQQQP